MMKPQQILALTFSKEAPGNMREKVEKLLQGKEVIVKTFHSFWAYEYDLNCNYAPQYLYTSQDCG